MTDLVKHYDTSDEARLNRLYKRFRQHHVDIQRLWKLCAPLGDGIPQGGGAAFSPPFDEPPSGGTALTGTPCKNRYCVSRYAGACTQIAAGGVVSWSSVTSAEDAPDGAAATVQFLNDLNAHSSYRLVASEFGFSIPDDAIVVSAKAYLTAKKLADVVGNANIGIGGYFHFNGTLLIQAINAQDITNTDYLEISAGQQGQAGVIAGGITADIVNSSQFGFLFHTTSARAAKGFVDSIRLEVCYDLYTLSGTCSENPG